MYTAIDHDVATAHNPMTCSICDTLTHEDGGEGEDCYCPVCNCCHVEGGGFFCCGRCGLGQDCCIETRAAIKGARNDR